MQFREFFSIAMLLSIFSTGYTQPVSTGTVNGYIVDNQGLPVQSVSISIRSLNLSYQSDNEGQFSLKEVPAGNYTIYFSAIGFVTKEYQITVRKGMPVKLKIVMQSSDYEMKEVVVKTQTDVHKAKDQAFSVDVIDVKKLRDRDIDFNRLIGSGAGVRVKETGGIGSDFNYSIHGLSDKSIRFFIDGVPMDLFGAGYSINNFPVNMIDRIEVYKGVVPVNLGSDALGGAINIITRKDKKNYADISYSAGSFQTHKSAFIGKWRDKNSGLSVLANTFYNYSKNNYKVWGETIEVGGNDGRPLEGIHKLRRFNDDYSAWTVQTEVGFTDIKWADQFLLGMTFSDMEKGIQTGRTMAFVFGKVRYAEDFLMPSLKYSKKNFLHESIHLDLYAAVNKLNGTTTDTSSRKYNWLGEALPDKVNGELDGISAQKSVMTITDHNSLMHFNLGADLKENHTLNFNYNLNYSKRSGKNQLDVPEWTIPYTHPQHINKHIVGLSYESRLYEKRLNNVLFIKHNYYQASANIYDYVMSDKKTLIAVTNSNQNWGWGYAAKYLLKDDLIIKLSVENTTRLPEAIEMFGNASNILISPNLKPEQSLNANLALHTTFRYDKERTLNIAGSLFYRDTENLILLGASDHKGRSTYENINKVRGKGGELEFNYNHGKWLTILLNTTYQDIRNAQRYLANGAKNLTYNDRLKNTPYLMANAEITLNKSNWPIKEAISSLYISSNYIHEYTLNWSGLGSKNEQYVIPVQFVQDIGISCAFDNNKYSLSLQCRNIFDQLVYDNFLLQKPGRSASIKLRYFIN